ncbi:hypothetical protein AHMF7605_26170 [Adhaeribacter arboris]|uniref:Uncharacterized protein n=1 Tax=Adhaeribacter arboris TaxID=2072846 RepID=A0A2T2YMJ4_9BACT|nr:hypothetical protein [Adhaeribacter arboris]PSR56732.1 hypothetical protein AHMF7605_26170 [Adhaeribacter arboris]
MQITLKVPVKPYVQKYLIARYGTIYQISKRDAIGIVLYQMLRRPATERRASKRMEQYSAIYPIIVSSKDFWKRGCRNLDDYTSIQLNNLVEDLFQQEFCAYIENLEAHAIEQRYAIEAFMAKYNLDECDIKFETIKKAYQRYRIQQEKLGILPLKIAHLLPYLCLLKVLTSRKKLKKVVQLPA